LAEEFRHEGTEPALVQPSKKSRASNFAVEIVIVIFWCYSLLQIFIGNVDGTIISLLSREFHWIIEFKFLVFLAIASGLLLWLGTKNAVLLALYAAFYPAIVLIYKIPRFLYQKESWLLAIGAINAMIYFFRKLKINLLILTAYLVSLSCALLSTERHILITASVTLAVLICFSFVRSFVTALQPSEVLKLYSTGLRKVREWRSEMFSVDQQVRNLPLATLDRKQLDLWNRNLQNSVIFNRLCLFAANRLRDYQRSEWRLLPAIIGLLSLVFMSVFCFTAINFSLYKVNPEQFSLNGTPDLFSFFFYSFNVAIFNSTIRIEAVEPWAQWTFILQSSLSFVLALILATLFISNRAQRFSSELDDVIRDLEAEADEMDSLIRNEYYIAGVVAAIEHLNFAKSELIRVILWLSDRIDQDRR